MLRFLFAAMVAIHGVIHLMGVMQAFGRIDEPILSHPVSKWLGVLWLSAALLQLTLAAALFVKPRDWWTLAVLAVAVSQAAILTSWSDAKFGTIANLAILAGTIHHLRNSIP